ncbi:MAG: response regulator [Saprospiraceae bacterium]
MDEKPTLLIIEDNTDVVTYIVGLLKKEYEIHTAPNGQIGIDMALEMIPDIIISDVMMPEKDGYEVCEVLKNDERTSHIPIILLTAKATVEDRIEGLRGGADAYLVKPFHKEELFVRLAKLIALRQSLQASYSSSDVFSKPAVKKEPTLDDLFLQKLIKVVEEKLDDPDLSPTYLCQVVKRSSTQVNRKLKALTGKTPSQFIRSIRLRKAFELLKTTDLNISEIAYEVGFNDPNYFTRSFSEEFGHPPNKVRK